MTFNDLHLSDPILRALKDINYTQPTPIQEQAITPILEGKDVLASAQTGTGKTAAFTIPVIQQLENQHNNFISCLIVTPTRELAIQIGENIESYSKYTNVRHTVIYGGVKQNRQVNRIKKGVDILVATPGRLLDLQNQGYVSLKNIKILILDEADRMLDMGFINDIKKIIASIPKKRQTLFFSATLPENIVQLSKQILYKPVKIEVSPQSTTAETVQQEKYLTNKSDKKKLLFHLLKDQDLNQVLIFARTKHGSNRIARDLSKQKIKATAIHGDKSQNQRQKALQDFKDGKLRVLVATDIASRGIDIDKLEYVINYEIPNEPEVYVHRIGRSGRAGESGRAISLVEPEELDYIDEIEDLIGLAIPEIEDHPFPQTDKPMTEAEKKEANKEKSRRKQEFFENRKKDATNKNSKPSRSNSRRR